MTESTVKAATCQTCGRECGWQLLPSGLCESCQRREAERLERESRARRIETPAGEREAGVPLQYRGARFADFGEHEDALRAWYAGGSVLFLFGSPGVGKTRLLFCVRRAAWVDGIRVLGGRAADVAREAAVRVCLSAADEREYLRLLGKSGGIVLLDDLGAERVTEYAAGVLEGIISDRQEWSRRVAVASNLDLDGVARVFGDRTASRLASGLVLPFDGPDRRLAKGGGK